jgi:hypothetical protein
MLLTTVGANGTRNATSDPPRGALDPATGNLLVVWSGGRKNTRGLQILAAVRTVAGGTVKAPIQLSGTPVAGVRDSNGPNAAWDPASGNWKVVWVENEFRQHLTFIVAQTIGADGEAIGAPVRLNGNGDANGFQTPGIACGDTGTCLVTWSMYRSRMTSFVAQVVDATGAASGDPQVVRETPVDDEGTSTTWNQVAREWLVGVADDNGVFIRRVAATGEFAGPATQLSRKPSGVDGHFGVSAPALTANPTSGDYLAAWNGNSQYRGVTGRNSGTFLQRLSADATPIGRDGRGKPWKAAQRFDALAGNAGQTLIVTESTSRRVRVTASILDGEGTTISSRALSRTGAVSAVIGQAGNARWSVFYESTDLKTPLRFYSETVPS